MTMNGNKKYIYFLSAADRINYGDLLFPLVFKKFCEEKNVEFKNYGIVKSNFSTFKALPTHSYKRMLRDIDKDNVVLVIGGGEVFFTNWTKLYGFINPTYRRFTKSKLFRRIDKHINSAALLLSSNRVKVPFVPSKEELGVPRMRIAYNSVGGRFVGSKTNQRNQHINDALKSADYISVRDQRCQSSLKSHDIESILIPDSALLMSDLYSVEFLKQRVSFDLTNTEFPYLFLQLGSYKGPDHISKFVETIQSLSDKTGLNVILCPIGLAPGHEDDKILKKLKQINSGFIYIEPDNIFDIMFLIAKSSLYLGTSLHGMITAQSYNVAFIPLNKSVKKMDAYVKTWVSETLGCVDFYNEKAFLEIYKDWDYEQISKNTKIQKTQILNNIEKIIAL